MDSSSDIARFSLDNYLLFIIGMLIFCLGVIENVCSIVLILFLGVGLERSSV